MDESTQMAPPTPPTDDGFDRLVTRLLAVSEIAWVPPPLDATIAEAVLGAAGAPRTPHRRLLERMNGGFFFERALHVLGACAQPGWHSLARWNAPELWRDAYGDDARGLIFFAEDAFGDQYAYTGKGGEVVCFEAELGRVVPVAPHFRAWLESLLDGPEAVLPIDVLRGEAREGRTLPPGHQLYAWPPLCSAEAQQEGITIGHVDAVEAMRFRGELSRTFRGVAPGTRVKVEIPE